MRGTYIMKPIWKHCAEKRTPAEVVEWRGDRVLLRDLSFTAPGKDFLIETGLDSFEPDAPAEAANGL